MAGRSPKIGLPYFMHDTDMSSDPKFEYIEATHGIIGFAVILKIYERIYRDGYFTNWPERDVPIFARKIGVDVTVVRSIVKDAITEGIFDAEMVQSYSILTSHGIQKRFIHATSKRVASAIDPKYNLLNLPPKGDVFISASEIPISAEEIPISEEEIPIPASEMQQVSKERKGKEREAEEAERAPAPQPLVGIDPLVIPEDQYSARDGTSLKAYLLHTWGVDARRLSNSIFTRMLDLGMKFGWEKLYYAIDEGATHDAKTYSYVVSIVDPSAQTANKNRKEMIAREAFLNDE